DFHVTGVQTCALPILLQPSGGVNALPELIGLPRLSFRWLTTRRQIWRFDWNDLPTITGVVVAIVLLYLAWRAWRAGKRGRAWTRPEERRVGQGGEARA